MNLNEYEISFLKDLIAIPSVGSKETIGCPYGIQPKRALDFFIGEASSKGFRTGIIDDKVGFAEFGEGSRLIGIVCHLDVVPAGSGWTTDPFKLEIKDDTFYGRGIVDDKGPACAAYFAMKRLKDRGVVPSGRIRLILGSDEERSCDCVETYASKGEIPDFAITPDGEFPVIFAEKGILQIKISGPGNDQIKAAAGSAANMVPAQFDLTFGETKHHEEGVCAHASKPDLGINAIIKAAEGLDENIIGASPLLSFVRNRICGKDYASYTGCVISDDSGTVTANPAILEIGPEAESLIIDIRYPVSADLNEIVAYISGNAAEYGLSTGIVNHMPPLYKEKDTEEIRILTEIWKENMASYTGYKDEYASGYVSPIAIGGGTYARHLPNTIAFGVQTPWQEDQCHQANEHMPVKDFEATVKILEEAITRLLSEHSSCTI